MAPRPVLEFPPAGDRIIVRTSAKETDGAWAAFEFVHPRRTRPTIAHYHTTREETFEILAGSAAYRLDGVTHHARAGDRFFVPEGTDHVHPWNTGDGEMRYSFVMRATRPDRRGMLSAEASFALLAELARAGELKPDLSPRSLLQASLILYEAMPSIYLTGWSVPAQRLVFGTLARLGRVRGYKPPAIG